MELVRGRKQSMDQLQSKSQLWHTPFHRGLHRMWTLLSSGRTATGS